MSSKVYGIGIIGVGSVAASHALAIAELPNARLIAACCRTEQKGRDFAAKYSCQYMSDYYALVARPDIDVVTICTPSGSHTEPALAAIHAGKHVLSEKPLDITLSRIDKMISAAHQAGVKLGGIFNLRFGPGVAQVKQAIESGRFGRLTFIGGYGPWWRDQNYYYQSGWRGTWALDGGGALMNQGIHNADLLLYLAGPVKRVQASTARIAHPQIEGEDTAVATMEFQNGALGILLAATSMNPNRLRTVEISGDAGTAVLIEQSLQFWQFAQEQPQDAEIRRILAVSPATSDTRKTYHLCFVRNYQSFLLAVDQDTEPQLNGPEARKAVELVLAIYRSTSIGKPVILPFQTRD